MHQTKIIICTIVFFIALMVINLNSQISSLHLITAKAYAIKDLDEIFKSKLVSIASDLTRLTFILSLITVGISILLIREKVCHVFFGIGILVVSLYGFLLSIVIR